MFAAALAERMGTSHLELDSLYHQKDWEPLPDEEFRSAVIRVIGGERWVVDGNYPQVVKRLVWAAADTVIWLDPPRYRAMLVAVGSDSATDAGPPRTVEWEPRERRQSL